MPPDAPTQPVPVAAPPSIVGVAGAVALDAAHGLAAAGKKEPGQMIRWFSTVAIVGILATLCYFLVKDARDEHAITKPEMDRALAERDARVNPATDVEIGRLRAALESVRAAGEATGKSVEGLRDDMRTMRAESKVEREALRTEIREQSARLDRVLERLPK